MKVVIDADDRRIEIECVDTNTTVSDVARGALETWRATAPTSKRGAGIGYGLVTGERKPDARGAYGLGLGEGQPLPVVANGAH